MLGVAHVFVSVLTGGAFHAPVQVDSGLLGPSSSPAIVAGQNGVLLVAFINGGALYVNGIGGLGGSFGSPGIIYPAAASPSLSMSNFGKAYLAFTATNGAGGGDVRTAYYFQGQWALEPSALDANPADAAGQGSGRPVVASAGDGVAIVAWGENGHVYTRRVVKTSPSVVYEQADPGSVDGRPEVSSGYPVVGAGGDSSYATVAFEEQISSGGGTQGRVLVNRLHGSVYDGLAEADGALTGGPEGADHPELAVSEYGAGWVTSEHDQTHQLFAAALGNNDTYHGTTRVDSLPNNLAPDAVPAMAGLYSTFIAWQQDPGTSGPAEIRLRFAPNGSDLGPEEVISSPLLGAANASAGLAAGGDVSGDAAVAWVQGTGANTRIVAEQLYQPPGGFSPLGGFHYTNSAFPVLAWKPSSELWGPPQYVVRVAGNVVGQTTATQFAPPAPLPNGRDRWQVTAVNAAGLTVTASAATVFVDTVPPTVSFTLSGTRVIGRTIRIRVAYHDLPPAGDLPSAASGVATVYVKWGDGTPQARIRRVSASHAYQRRRTYTVTVIATDRAGNRTVVTKRIKIKRPPKPKPKRKPKHVRHVSRQVWSATLRVSPRSRG